jgi:hypothetical protein
MAVNTAVGVVIAAERYEARLRGGEIHARRGFRCSVDTEAIRRLWDRFPRAVSGGRQRLHHRWA